jgi:GntR family transcriptional regulator
VAAGARRLLLEQRRRRFAEHYVEPLVTEATRLAIGTDELVTLVRESSNAQAQEPSHAQAQEASDVQGGVTV